jgi:hypothetical protein
MVSRTPNSQLAVPCRRLLTDTSEQRPAIKRTTQIDPFLPVNFRLTNVRS